MPPEVTSTHRRTRRREGASIRRFRKDSRAAALSDRLEAVLRRAAEAPGYRAAIAEQIEAAPAGFLAMALDLTPLDYMKLRSWRAEALAAILAPAREMLRSPMEKNRFVLVEIAFLAPQLVAILDLGEGAAAEIDPKNPAQGFTCAMALEVYMAKMREYQEALAAWSECMAESGGAGNGAGGFVDPSMAAGEDGPDAPPEPPCRAEKDALEAAAHEVHLAALALKVACGR
jgi:hypothetical protein